MNEEPERKLVAILAADMVGFSRQLGRDEAGTLARLDAARRGVIDPAIAAQRGRIFKEMGDGLLAEFPSAVLALRAAIAIQTALADRGSAPAGEDRVVLRIGVHQGEAVIAGADLLGDGVNVAARIEPLAPPGGICISARVQEDSIGKLPLACEDLGERMLKNIARPVRVLRVMLPWEDVAEPEDDAGRTMVRVAPGAEAAERTLVRRAPPPPRVRDRLVVSTPDGIERQVPLGDAPLLIGRVPPCGLVLDDREVSRRHCSIERIEGAVLLTDLQSTNGTFVDGRKIAAPVRLVPGMRVVLGSHTLRYEREAFDIDPEATGAAHRTFVRLADGRDPFGIG
ncbi:MAG: adenylate/guanylate cyclase domain-containing protein [Rhodospirillales bacterium]|nr:adenylate/guanylate cyclase domain-containing protein [Rhodospirillales bacterium]